MPLIRINAEIHYFAHVPRAAGTSVEAYLSKRFGSLALLDETYTAQPLHQRWSHTSPQHIDATTLQRFFPNDWITSSFAVVRHPVSRIVSAFRHQAEVVGTVPQGMDVNEWLLEWYESAETDPYLNDNHLRRQTEFVPEDATVFHIERGLDALVAHLDQLAGRADGARQITIHPSRRSSGGGDTLSERSLAFIEDYYADDFVRFGYDADEPSPATRAKPKGFFARFGRAT